MRLARIENFRLPAAAVVVIALFPAMTRAQERVDTAKIAAIQAEERDRSAASELFYTLTDKLGPRLSGSPAYDQAARWALDRFRQWGLADPRLEPFKLGRAWTLEKLTVEITAPRYMPLLGYAEAWSPSTSGGLTGAPMYVGDSTIEEIDALGSRLRGAIILTARPQTEFLRKDRPEPSQGSGSVQTGNPTFPGPSSRTPQREILSRLQKLGAGVALAPSATPRDRAGAGKSDYGRRRRACRGACVRTVQHARPHGESR
jgi:carboxypeptidase Q